MQVSMSGPGMEYIGGVTAVIQSWMQSRALQGVDVRYYATVGSGCVGPRHQKVLQMATCQARFARDLVRGWRPDLFHLHAGGIFSIYRKALYAAECRAAGRPVVFHIHSSNRMEELYARGPVQARSVERLLSEVSAVVTVSGHMRGVIQDWMSSDYPVYRLYNPVDTTEFALRSEAPDPPRPTVLFMGWIKEPKGIFDLLDAVERVRKTIPDVLFRFGGDGVDMQRFQQEVRERELDRWVEVLGWIVDEDRRSAYSRADVFCLPSHSEGMPITVLEAMAAGLPVVASRISGIPEQVLEGKTGYLVGPRDPAGLAEALIQVLEDRPRARAMGEAGRARACEFFDREAVTRRLVEIWKQVLADHG